MINPEETIRKTIRMHDLLSKGDHVILGLSGGPDSTCLFHVLLSMREELDLTIHPVHVNHKFRPGDAERDQEHVENMCRRLGVPERTIVVDCNALARELGMTSEEAGRKARYDAFYDCAEKVAEFFGKGAEDFAREHVKIAVAQNADDQAETILFRIIRGTGTEGIAGIAYEREERRGDRAYKVIRPLLDTWREDIEAYCESKGLETVTDHTNNEEIYSRNRIRLDLIPYIKGGYNSNISECLCRLGSIAGEDKDYFRKITGETFDELRLFKDSAGTPFGGDVVVLDREGLARCHPAVRHRVVQKAFTTIGLTRDITAERLRAADEIIGRKQSAKTVEFPHGYSVTVARGRVLFERRK